MLNNDTGIRYPEKCESELGFGKYLEFGLIKEKDTQKNTPRKNNECKISEDK